MCSEAGLTIEAVTNEQAQGVVNTSCAAVPQHAPPWATQDLVVLLESYN